MANPVTFSAIVLEAAEDVVVMVETLTEIANLVDLLRQKQDNSRKILDAISKMEKDLIILILDEEYRTYFGTIYSAARLWYGRDRERVKSESITRKSLGLDPKPADPEEAKGWGALGCLHTEVLNSVRDLTKSLTYFVSRPAPIQLDSPRILSTTSFCTTLLSTLSLVEAGIYALSADESSVVTASSTATLALKDGYAAATKWETEYLSSRRKLIAIKNQLESEFRPPRLVGYEIVSDASKGDELLENLAGKDLALEFIVNDGSSDHGMVNELWNNSKSDHALHGLSLQWHPVFERKMDKPPHTEMHANKVV